MLPSDARPVLGLRSDAAAYAANAKYLRNVVLPSGWQLSLVQKCECQSGRQAPSLDCLPARLVLLVCVLAC